MQLSESADLINDLFQSVVFECIDQSQIIIVLHLFQLSLCLLKQKLSLLQLLFFRVVLFTQTKIHILHLNMFSY